MGGIGQYFTSQYQQNQQNLPPNLQAQDTQVPPGTGGIKSAPPGMGQQVVAPPGEAVPPGGAGPGYSTYNPQTYQDPQSQQNIQMGRMGYGGRRPAWPGQGYGGFPGFFGGGSMFGGHPGGGYGGMYGGGGYGMGGFPMGNQFGPGSYSPYGAGSMGYGGGSGMMGGGFNQMAHQLGGYPGGSYTGGGGKGGGQPQQYDPMGPQTADWQARESAISAREAAQARLDAQNKKKRYGWGQAQDHKCFIEGTMVKLIDGRHLPIEQVKIGDVLYGHDGDPAKVLDYDRPVLGDRLLYSINKGPHFTTQDHPFYTRTGWKSFDPDRTNETNKYLEAETLKIGDEILTLDGWVKVEFISMTDAHPMTQLYNFVLDGDPTYFADGYLVHTEQ